MHGNGFTILRRLCSIFNSSLVAVLAFGCLRYALVSVTGKFTAGGNFTKGGNLCATTGLDVKKASAHHQDGQGSVWH
jgi:hypothetical protein